MSDLKLTCPDGADVVARIVAAEADIDTAEADIDGIESHLKNHVMAGGIASDPTTGSSHADGSTFDFNVNLAALVAIVNGVVGEFAAQVDFDVAHDSSSPIDGTDTDIIYTIVLAEASGSITCEVVAGAAAPAVSVAAPTTAAITTAVGHANWIRLCNVQYHRSGAATCTETQDNTVRAYYV